MAPEIKHWSDIERYIERKRRLNIPRPSAMMKAREMFNEMFRIKIDGKSVFIWHSRRFEEIAYMHVPRFLFLSGSIWVIYQINLRQL